MQFVIITGMSGSGKSSAVNVLEDIGYYCVDNMPPELIPKFANICSQSDGKIDKVAFVVDIRGGDLFLKLQDTVKQLQGEGVSLKILFLDSSDDVIVRRYKETRRKHPLVEVSYGNIRKAIETEREILRPIKAQADFYIDTSRSSTAQFKERLYSIFLGNNEFMHIDVQSFGFKFGAMSEGDLVFDVRCLPNPFYVPELKNKTGLDKDVYDYVLSFDEAKVLLGKLTDLIDYLIPLYEKEGKSQLVIAFGCTGGKHRSVTFAEAVAEHLRKQGHRIRITHRDINNQ
ncbi:RNase adapter RapZ [Ruminococcus bicirculans (ex Wegman et al. 2014)]|uniref:RNase adapter RapZ n=1 Tax=Ruminococcus bicirculans (ex Wegman et al. 2014) TaxID=1160721 RepID=UPI003A8FF315